MTQRCFYQDAYTRSFDANVVERIRHNQQPALILDKTFFYPISGGQPADHGQINGVPVEDVLIREADGAVVHVLGGEVWTEEINGEIDWARRFDHMQQHTGQHILSQAFVQVTAARTIGFHLSENSVTIDLSRGDLKPEEVEAAESLANQIIWEDRRIRIHMVPVKKAEEMSLRKLPAVDGDTVRLIDIEKFDLTACGGTHVSRTGAVGQIKVVKLEPRRDQLRVEFCCGKRALIDYRRKNRIITRLAAEFTTGYSELEQSVTRLREEVKQAHRQSRQQRVELMQLLGSHLLHDATEKNGYRIVTQAFDDKDADDLKILANRLVEHPGAVALLGISGEKAQLLFARAEKGPGSMNELLKSALQVLGSAAGGGSPKYAQGGGPAADIDRVEQALARAERLLLAQIH